MCGEWNPQSPRPLSKRRTHCGSPDQRRRRSTPPPSALIRTFTQFALCAGGFTRISRHEIHATVRHLRTPGPSYRRTLPIPPDRARGFSFHQPSPGGERRGPTDVRGSGLRPRPQAVRRLPPEGDAAAAARPSSGRLPLPRSQWGTGGGDRGRVWVRVGERVR